MQSESRISSTTIPSATKAGKAAKAVKAARGETAIAASRASARDAAPPADEVDVTVRVYFEVDSHNIGDEYVALIREQAVRFNRATGGSLIVSGQSNPVDGVEAAVRLSMDRTQAVASMLESFGVQSHRIVCVSRGASEPAAGEVSATARRETRCVEIRHGALAPRQPVWSQRLRKPGRR